MLYLKFFFLEDFEAFFGAVLELFVLIESFSFLIDDDEN